jgi:hypothetical protein
MSECKAVLYLREMQHGGDETLSVLAKVVLSVISDVRENHLTKTDTACLVMLIGELAGGGGKKLLDYLVEGTPDCDICAALAKELRLHERP